MRRTTIHERLVHKLHPCRLRTSGKFTAILACLLGEKWTDPGITSLTITSDGHLLGMGERDLGYNQYLGTRTDLLRNLNGVADVVKLTKPERKRLLELALIRG